jgi:uncharacterized membrane protein
MEQIEIKAPIVDCYKMGIAFDKYHDISKSIKSIKQKGSPDVWHWEVEGPNGQLLEWDVELRGKKHSNQVISWHTLRQGDIAHSGAITFNQIDEATTSVQLVIEYSSSSDAYPNWELEQYGQRVAEKSLQSFKELVETNTGANVPLS